MKKLFLAIALSVIAITGVISFVACSDDDKEVKNSYERTSKSLIELFNTKEFFSFSKDAFETYIIEVSSEIGIDIIALSQSQAISNMDSITLSECFLNKIKNDELSAELIDTMQVRERRMSRALDEGDSATAASLSIWFSNLFECKTIRDEIESRYSANRDIAIASLANIEEYFPAITSLNDNDKAIVLALAYYYKQENLPQNKALTAADCQRGYNSEITLATAAYFVNLSGCAAFVVPWVVGVCAVSASTLYYLDVRTADKNYKSCMAVVH